MAASHESATSVVVGNPGMCPDWESNWQPFGSEGGAQSTEPHQPGPHALFLGMLITAGTIENSR